MTNYPIPNRVPSRSLKEPPPNEFALRLTETGSLARRCKWLAATSRKRTWNLHGAPGSRILNPHMTPA